MSPVLFRDAVELCTSECARCVLVQVFHCAISSKFVAVPGVKYGMMRLLGCNLQSNSQSACTCRSLMRLLSNLQRHDLSCKLFPNLHAKYIHARVLHVYFRCSNSVLHDPTHRRVVQTVL